MKTLAQSWADRLAELRGICRENGERLTASLIEGFEREHANAWWSVFCEAAERGDDLPPSVWRSAEREGERRRMAGWVQRLRVRNEVAR